MSKEKNTNKEAKDLELEDLENDEPTKEDLAESEFFRKGLDTDEIFKDIEKKKKEAAEQEAEKEAEKKAKAKAKKP